jgi:hypothetical protein
MAILTSIPGRLVLVLLMPAVLHIFDIHGLEFIACLIWIFAMYDDPDAIERCGSLAAFWIIKTFSNYIFSETWSQYAMTYGSTWVYYDAMFLDKFATHEARHDRFWRTYPQYIIRMWIIVAITVLILGRYTGLVIVSLQGGFQYLVVWYQINFGGVEKKDPNDTNSNLSLKDIEDMPIPKKQGRRRTRRRG